VTEHDPAAAQVVACDEQVVVLGTYRGTYGPTGRRLVAEFCHVWSVADGVATRVRQFTDTAAFLHATAG
jgi:ketosteroid isomerase-like protein